ncbi:MAG: hypothetical protein ABFR36_06475 [Acidobacteriota bacterium]
MERLKIIWVTGFTALSVILIEILYTRLFSSIYFSSFAFLIISLALFGTGLSGLHFSLTKRKRRLKTEHYILLFALSLPVILKLTLTIKIDFLNLFSSPVNLIYLMINFLALILPFFLGGAVLVRIFADHSKEIGKLYFYDLAGAALGSLLIIPLISEAGPMNAILLVSIMLILTWLFISGDGTILKVITASLLILLFSAGIYFSADIFKLIPKIEKRDYINDLEKGRIEYSSWSPINKVDVAPFIFNTNKKVVWLNCGTQQTWFVRTAEDQIGKKELKWTHAAIPYQLANKGSALIIGSAGGYEVLCARSNGFKRIFAVEMDPELCQLVSGKYSEYIGNIFKQKGVFLINDEGRSVLKRLNKKFDVIQMVNSHPKDTLLSGGLSISETYIYSVPAFREYWDNLAEDGFLSIVHVYGERMFSTAFEALRRSGIRQPGKKFYVIQIKNGFNYFFMKKGDINGKDRKILRKFAGKNEIVYSPFEVKENVYYKLASPEYKKIIKDSSVNISPVSDKSPYFNQPNKIGQLNFSNNFLKGMATEKVERVRVYTNSVYLSIFFISIIFSIIFIYIPLRRRGGREKIRNTLYFSLIGLSFIIVEIILIKIFQLLLGNPSYSISIIIFSLLLSAGMGSYYSDKILIAFRNRMLNVSLFIAVILIFYALLLFDLIYLVIELPIILRSVISVFLISIPGVPMGIYFPLGIKKVSSDDPVMTGWAWGANAFATVLGSVVTVIISINLNFSAGLITAAVVYILAGLLFPED